MNKTLQILSAAIALAITGTASAADFTLNLPVEISDLQADVSNAKVKCWVSDEFGEPVAKGSTEIPTDGYSGTITVEANTAGMDWVRPPSAAIGGSWSCYLVVSKDGQNFARVVPDSDSDCQRFDERYRCGKTGAPFTDEVTGSL